MRVPAIENDRLQPALDTVVSYAAAPSGIPPEQRTEIKGRFFFKADDGIRADLVTGVQTCALPISLPYLDLYGKAGLARWKLNGSSPLVSAPFSTNGTEFAWGGGVQVHIGNIGGRLEYERFNIPNTNGARVFSLAVFLNLM